MHTSKDFERSAGPQGQRRQLVLVLGMVNVLERLHVWGVMLSTDIRALIYWIYLGYGRCSLLLLLKSYCLY